ncbi:hypothetical protein FHL15_005097 [Xylaria flabelliformis]|uniref:Transcription factor domain-containing protein n=1 Tax=Xylaria flabelliformis TaxID=2512241 RepID=A0A553I1E3_9PEZI|nr:hypothetical protein FHL15_005097 [Xylaria flabelliformis]
MQEKQESLRRLLDQQQARDGVLPCSYCVKTKKQCGLNSHWVARSQRSPLSPSADPRVEGGFPFEQAGTDNQDDFISIDSSDVLGLLQTPSPNHFTLDWGTPLPSLEGTTSTNDNLRLLGAEFSPDIDLHVGSQNITPGKSTASADHLPQGGEYISSPPYLDSALQAADFDHLTNISETSHLIPENSGNLTQSVYQSLLKIYHDVLENNLACWLAGDTCPYKMQLRRSRQRPDLGTTTPISQISSTARWDSVRPNSMYRRVKQLDRVAQATGLIQLTYAESQAASRALNLVIMAFAAQWAQGRRREKMFSTSPSSPAWSEDIPDDFADEFEQNFQQSIWEQAKRALQDVAGLESYRIVYAELIFGLIQRPWATSNYHRLSENSNSNDIKASLPRITEIISQDGPPVYTERASRKIQALKFHFEANETGLLRLNCSFSSRQQEDAISKMDFEERGTIGQLYWLAVMFDTISSSMNERPVALADEDCQHDGAYGSPDTIDHPTNFRWNLELFSQDDPSNPSTLSWPCPYDSAVKAINRSAAVKVLLFRYVSYLQNTIRKQERSYVIEEIIRNATQIYRYWNVTHGAFFRSLIKNYDTIPTPIKSRFPCIHIPWHLGALMLADLIEFVDQNGLGTEEASLNRLSIDLAMKIRKSSAVELSDLARVTTPRESCNMPIEQLPGYHFAVNEGSILTEPWTVLLIRAFTKASIFHLSAVEDQRRQEWAILGQESEEYKESLGRCDTCIKALWFLGRKSEMARSLSKVLAEVLRRQEEGLTSEQAFDQYSV